MNIYLRFFYVFIFTIALSACSQEKMYTKPELVGELYDSKTKRPIINTEGYVDFYLGEKVESKLKTNNGGRFYVKPRYKEYFFFTPKIDESIVGAPQIYISLKGYSFKTYDYSIKYQEQNKNTDPMGLAKVDVDVIYLDPEK